jgi:hypothetical protein
MFFLSYFHFPVANMLTPFCIAVGRETELANVYLTPVTLMVHATTQNIDESPLTFTADTFTFGADVNLIFSGNATVMPLEIKVCPLVPVIAADEETSAVASSLPSEYFVYDQLPLTPVSVM